MKKEQWRDRTFEEMAYDMRQELDGAYGHSHKWCQEPNCRAASYNQTRYCKEHSKVD